MELKYFERRLYREQEELISETRYNFWVHIFQDMLTNSSFSMVNDFYLVNENISQLDVVEHFRDVVNSLMQKYDLKVSEATDSYGQEWETKFVFSLHISHPDISFMHDDLFLTIDDNRITLQVLHGSHLIKVFFLEEYLIVEKILRYIFDQLFDDDHHLFKDLIEQYVQIKKCANRLTPKSVEIAQNSIKAIYDACDEKIKNIVQKNLYTTLLAKGKRIRILHQEFLENPEVLIRQLKEGEN